MSDVLSGVRIIDLTQNVAGPYCTQVLGDLGAEVIKIERPKTGDDTRLWNPPSWGDQSATFLGLNRNKKSICVNLNSLNGQEIIKELAKDADIFIHSMKPGSLESRGIHYEKLITENPKLIYAAISAFGDEGALKNEPGYDPLIQAYTGVMSITGNPEDDPARVGVSIIDMATGMWSIIGIMSALIKRNLTGKGTKVTNSLLETGVAWSSLQLTNYMATGKVPEKIGTATPMIAPYEAFRTEDSWIIIAAGNNRLFKNLCLSLDLSEEILEDNRFKTNSERIKNRNKLHEIIERQTIKYESIELIHILRDNKVPCSIINTLDKVYSDEQVNAMNLIKEIENYRIDDFKIVDLPFKLDQLRGDYRINPPELGEHTQEILKALNYSESEIQEFKQNEVIG
ncbi:CaiB/BaiF CoA transferase family protein [Lentibacillus jeotgali]|uniref:CaiB/BaiF CoA transferase family protein n=1 Tax=Lentibacillus jeotgali TaxID=558169 RepID=UPI00026287C8|nr:CoA transferase [Lentibacillus jeotgali]